MSALALLTAGYRAALPPRRISVSEAAAAALVIDQPGGYSGPWAASEAPYMVEPMDMLTSRRHEAVVFAGPARSGKTMGLLDGWMTYCVTCDPGDMLIVQMSQEKAREFSKVRVDRAIRHSPQLKALMSTHGHDDNTHDKMWRHGMWLRLGWPTASQLASSDYRYVALTDYDRFPLDVDGEGAAFDLALKRTQTYLSRGMCVAESSPGNELTDPNWSPASPHEAPPAPGILGLYNRSDRRRWYWTCQECREAFEARPGLDLFATLPPIDELLERVRADDLPRMAAQHATIVCPHCGVVMGAQAKPLLNAAGRWVAEGQRLVAGRVEGEAPRATIAGYWLGGVAASYQSWHSIVLRYLQGLREYVLSGSEEGLKATTSTDQGMPYMSRALLEAAAGAGVETVESLARYYVPAETRFLLASVDVQGGRTGRFVCEVHAVGVGLEQWVVDRFELTRSPRGEELRCDPGAYLEDWQVLTEKLVKATYRLEDGRELRLRAVVVDSGGEAGTTANAYAWYRGLRRQGLAGRVLLAKGGTWAQTSPVTRATARDSGNKPIKDVPLYMFSTDFFKDILAANMRRKSPGHGFMHFPDWLPSSFFEELRSEVRGGGGKWKQIRKRNESFDLCAMILVGCWAIGAHKMNWTAPPGWARPLDTNSDVISREERQDLKAPPPPTSPFTAPRPAPARRSGWVSKW